MLLQHFQITQNPYFQAISEVLVKSLLIPSKTNSPIAAIKTQ